jgi:hypothetical protein
MRGRRARPHDQYRNSAIMRGLIVSRFLLNDSDREIRWMKLNNLRAAETCRLEIDLCAVRKRRRTFSKSENRFLGTSLFRR